MNQVLVRISTSEEGKRFIAAKDIWKALGDKAPNTYQKFLDCLRLMFPTEDEFNPLFAVEDYNKKSGKKAKRYWISEFIAFYVATVYLNYKLAVSIQEGGKDAESK